MIVMFGQTNGRGVLEPPLDAGNYDASLDGDKLNADNRDSYKGIDDNAFVKYAIEDFRETGSTGRSLNQRWYLPHSDVLDRHGGLPLYQYGERLAVVTVPVALPAIRAPLPHRA